MSLVSLKHILLHCELADAGSVSAIDGGIHALLI
jgi:hypothetical protein